MSLLLLVLILAYVVLSVLAWRFWQRHTDVPYPLRGEQSLLLLILLLHTFVVWQPMLQQHVLLVGFGQALNLITWLMVMLYWVGSFRYRLQGLQLALFPCSALVLLIALLLPGQAIAYPMHNTAFMIHVLSALLAYALFGITTLLAVLMLVRNYYLHRRKTAPQQSFLPPLLAIEKLMFQGLQAGFVLLTIAAVSGTVFSEAVFGEPARFNHKTVFGVLSWIIYLVILLRHHMQAWRGKKVAWWVIVSFVSLMLAYFGSKFVLEILF